MKPLVSMREALDDPHLFGDVLSGDSWQAWRVLLIAMMGERLTDDERPIFSHLTKRDHEPLMPVEEFWGVVGRRGGKTRAMSVLSAYLAGLCDWRDVLVPGERGRLIYAAYNQKQASVALGYATALFTDLPLFAQLVEDVSKEVISLRNGIDLEVRAATWRGLRSITAIGAIFDELAFFHSDDLSANADREILTAIRPALATTGGPLIAISSPFAKRGEVYAAVERDHHPEGDPLILVARGASRTFNPSLPQKVVDRAMERDAAAARAEYLGEFRDDLVAFVDREAVQACIRAGVSARMPMRMHLPYFAFCDPSGGSSDSMTLAIAHNERRHGEDVTALDLVIEKEPPFRPEDVVRQFADTLKRYGVHTVTGDAFGSQWVAEAFRRYDITYQQSSLTKSEIFLTFLPMLNSSEVQLLDVPKLVGQFASLQRRVTGSGREVIDHASQQHDDVANAVAGAVTLAALRRRKATTRCKFIPV